jgi:orotate phosphoribosyltransferase
VSVLPESASDDELAALLVEHALLEGDFVLRSGKRSTWYLDKYRFETDPRLLRALGARLADGVDEVEPHAVRLAGPALGAVALTAATSMASDLPFIIVRGETKEYGTENRIEGPFDAGDVVCLLEDVVTTGGALGEAVSALRDEGLVVRNAICVVDREEGGSDALARLGVRLHGLFRASDLLELRKTAGKRDGRAKSGGLLGSSDSP